jgi:hypothetical protein
LKAQVAARGVFIEVLKVLAQTGTGVPVVRRRHGLQRSFLQVR